MATTIGSRLANARHHLHLTQAEVARRAGTTQAAISLLERGKLDPQLSTLLELTRALELELRLIPRQIVPAIDATIRDYDASTASDPDRPLYSLDAVDTP